MSDGMVYNFYGASVDVSINDPTAFIHLIKKVVPGQGSRLRYMILSPYCFYYLKPLWADNTSFTYIPEKSALLGQAGVMGKLSSPFLLNFIVNHALPTQRVFFVTSAAKRDEESAPIGDKFTQALLYHLISHVDLAQSVLALRGELDKL